MKEKGQYYVLKEKAVPDVLLRVVEAKRLLDSGKTDSVQDATEQVGISRSSFYKYKDDIFPFHETAKGKTITMVIQLDDEPGLLSIVLKTVAEFHANILTIHQSIPDQRDRIADTLGRCSAGDGRCDTDGGEHRGADRDTLCEDPRKRVGTE